MKTVRRVVILVAAVLASVVLVESSAFAATSEAVVITSGTVAGKAWFNSGPNTLVVKDEKCDGRYVEVEGFYLNVWSYAKVDTGCGTEMTFTTIGDELNSSQKPTPFQYRICAKSAWPSTCGAWVWDTIQ